MQPNSPESAPKQGTDAQMMQPESPSQGAVAAIWPDSQVTALQIVASPSRQPGTEPSHGAVAQQIARSVEEVDSAQQPSGAVAAITPLQHLAGVAERLQQFVPAAVHPDAGLGLEPSHGAVAQQIAKSVEEIDSAQQPSVEPESAPSQGAVVQQTESGMADLAQSLVQSAPSQGADAPSVSPEGTIAPRLAQPAEDAEWENIEAHRPAGNRASGSGNSSFEALAYYPEAQEVLTSDTDTNEHKALPKFTVEGGDAESRGADAQQDESQSIFSQGAVVQQNEPREGETIVDMRKRLQKDEEDKLEARLFGDQSSDEPQEGCVFIACWRFGL